MALLLHERLHGLHLLAVQRLHRGLLLHRQPDASGVSPGDDCAYGAQRHGGGVRGL